MKNIVFSLANFCFITASWPISILAKLPALIIYLSIAPSTRQLIEIVKVLPEDRRLEAKVIGGCLEIKVF
jgi:hypothetical protein